MSDLAIAALVSDYLKFCNHGRLHISRYGSSNRTDSRVIVIGIDGNLAMVIQCATDDDAELELISIGEQIDRWEAAKAAKIATANTRSGRR